MAAMDTVTGVELRDEQGHLQAMLYGDQLEIRRGDVVTRYDLRRALRVDSRRVQPYHKRGRQQRGGVKR